MSELELLRMIHDLQVRVETLQASVEMQLEAIKGLIAEIDALKVKA